jgi:hypothetical protein
VNHDVPAAICDDATRLQFTVGFVRTGPDVLCANVVATL